MQVAGVQTSRPLRCVVPPEAEVHIRIHPPPKPPPASPPQGPQCGLAAARRAAVNIQQPVHDFMEAARRHRVVGRRRGCASTKHICRKDTVVLLDQVGQGT